MPPFCNRGLQHGESATATPALPCCWQHRSESGPKGRQGRARGRRGSARSPGRGRRSPAPDPRNARQRACRRCAPPPPPPRTRTRPPREYPHSRPGTSDALPTVLFLPRSCSPDERSRNCWPPVLMVSQITGRGHGAWLPRRRGRCPACWPQFACLLCVPGEWSGPR